LSAEVILEPGCWVQPNNKGYAVLGWNSSRVQRFDWVGLYNSVSDPGILNSIYINSLTLTDITTPKDAKFATYQWVTRGHPYVTSHAYTGGIHARYFR
jgi:hypothetical protein